MWTWWGFRWSTPADVLTFVFSLRVSQDVRKHRNPYVVRAAFCKLLCCAYVDRDPYRAMEFPKLSRKNEWSEFKLPSAPNAGYFDGIRLFVEGYLAGLGGYMRAWEVGEGRRYFPSWVLSFVLCLMNAFSPAAQMDQNKLTLSVLDICHRLVDFGAYASVVELKGLLSSVIVILDGSNDICDPADDNVVRQRLLPRYPAPPPMFLAILAIDRRRLVTA
jgi:hypothetical protein